ncbi:uncharacterized protein [Rutidosis leptorrhynchoides]|uniref:uncharacterized protein n=1 Tax=Rutidosis leptorrhynchoides TaxID=125765 RepID=UPI003A9A1790
MIQIWYAGHVRKAEVLEEWACAPITFLDFWRVCPTDLPVTITATVGCCKVSRIYVDTGSAIDILYEHCFLKLPQEVHDKLKPPLHPVAGFTGETTLPLGRVSIDVTLEENEKRRTVALNFKVVRSQSRYNIIMGREAFCAFGAIVSTVYGMMKFPTPLGVPTIGNTLSNETKSAFCELLANNSDVFVWQELDMTGVLCSVAEHHLNANPNLTPVRQKNRGMTPERSVFSKKRVEKLVQANILREVKYQTWVSYPVLVKKANDSWRMYVDFKDINKACPKDNYPLPETDWKV